MDSVRTPDTKPNILDLSRLQLVLCVSPECLSLQPDLVLRFSFPARQLIKAMLHARQLQGWIPPGEQVGTCWPCSEREGGLLQINPIYQSFC